MDTKTRPLTDFTNATNGVDNDMIQNEIWVNTTIVTLFLGIQGDETDITFLFNSTISGAEETELDVVIAAHTGIPDEDSDLLKAITLAHLTIDDAAGEARARQQTINIAQDFIYCMKALDANNYKNAGYPADETGYEYITAEKNAKSVTATVAADGILSSASAKKGDLADIEEIRIKYKADCSAETNLITIEALSFKGKALIDAV